MKRLLFLALFLASAAFGQNVSIGTKNTTLKDAGVATFANSTFCLQETAGSDKSCINAPALVGSKVLTLPATTGTLALTGEAVTAGQMPALTGDITTSAGSVATTLATVNSNVGSFTAANITVNAKGLITAAANGSAGVPGGSNTQIQFNDSSAFGGDSVFTWDKTNHKMGLGVATPISRLSNTATDVTGTDTSGVDQAAGLAWANNAAGYTVGLYNAANLSNANGLAVKVRSTNAATLILDLSTHTSQNAAGTQVMGVYGDGTVKIPSLTSTRVVFAGTGGLLSGSASFVWDSSTSTLNIGGPTPAAGNDIYIQRTSTGQVSGQMQNLSTGTAAYSGWYVQNSNTANGIGVLKTSTGYTPSGLLLANQAIWYNAAGPSLILNADTSSMVFAVGGTAAANVGLTIKSGVAVMHGYAIGSLPAGTEGAIAYVTDQITACAAAGVAPTAGGALRCPVFYTGAAWVGM